MSARKQQLQIRSWERKGQILSKAHQYKRYGQAAGVDTSALIHCSSTQILKRKENSHVKPPKIIQEEIQKSSPKGSRSFSTALRNRQEGLSQSSRIESEGLAQFVSAEDKNEGLARSKSVENRRLSESQMSAAMRNPGHIFDLPTLPLPKNDRLKERYDPLILQVTNLLMRDGKKGLAQRV